MKAKGVIYVLAAIVIAAFAVANWTLLTQPVEINLLVVRITAPLAVLLLLLASLVLLLDFGVHAVTEHAWTRDRRAWMRELEVTRLRAEQAAEARTGASTTAIQKELAVIRAQLDRVLAAQSTLVRHSPDEIEPELIPPDGTTGRGMH